MLFEQLMSSSSPMTPVSKSARPSIFEINFPIKNSRFKSPLTPGDDTLDAFKLNQQVSWNENIFNSVQSSSATNETNNITTISTKANSSTTETNSISTTRSLYFILDSHYRIISDQLIKYQSLTTGLFPIFSNGQESTIGHVNDTLLCTIAIWSLRQCYSKVDTDQGRTYHLGQIAVKAMRGILFCWMKQADKLEKFKTDPFPKNALHSKFNITTGQEIEDVNYGHLQINCVSLYLITLAQLTTSNLQIIYSVDEVNFVQNLVFYIERAYRIPDYGMFERGSKYNNNECELHASSIAMAKAALESINGFNLYGDNGCSWSVVYVDIDAHNRNRSTLETLLPRESSSKVISKIIFNDVRINHN